MGKGEAGAGRGGGRSWTFVRSSLLAQTRASQGGHPSLEETEGMGKGRRAGLGEVQKREEKSGRRGRWKGKRWGPPRSHPSPFFFRLQPLPLPCPSSSSSSSLPVFSPPPPPLRRPAQHTGSATPS